MPDNSDDNQNNAHTFFYEQNSKNSEENQYYIYDNIEETADSWDSIDKIPGCFYNVNLLGISSGRGYEEPNNPVIDENTRTNLHTSETGSSSSQTDNACPLVSNGENEANDFNQYLLLSQQNNDTSIKENNHNNQGIIDKASSGQRTNFFENDNHKLNVNAVNGTKNTYFGNDGFYSKHDPNKYKLPKKTHPITSVNSRKKCNTSINSNSSRKVATYLPVSYDGSSFNGVTDNASSGQRTNFFENGNHKLNVNAVNGTEKTYPGIDGFYFNCSREEHEKQPISISNSHKLTQLPLNIPRFSSNSSVSSQKKQNSQFNKFVWPDSHLESSANSRKKRPRTGTSQELTLLGGPYKKCPKPVTSSTSVFSQELENLGYKKEEIASIVKNNEVNIEMLLALHPILTSEDYGFNHEELTRIAAANPNYAIGKLEAVKKYSQVLRQYGFDNNQIINMVISATRNLKCVVRCLTDKTDKLSITTIAKIMSGPNGKKRLESYSENLNVTNNCM